MERTSLANEAVRVAKSAKHNLKWIKKHPERIDESKRENMEVYLNRMIGFAKEERKNARLAGLTRLRCRLSNLVVAIIAHDRANS